MEMEYKYSSTLLKFSKDNLKMVKCWGILRLRISRKGIMVPLEIDCTMDMENLSMNKDLLRDNFPMVNLSMSVTAPKNHKKHKNNLPNKLPWCKCIKLAKKEPVRIVAWIWDNMSILPTKDPPALISNGTEASISLKDSNSATWASKIWKWIPGVNRVESIELYIGLMQAMCLSLAILLVRIFLNRIKISTKITVQESEILNNITFRIHIRNRHIANKIPMTTNPNKILSKKTITNNINVRFASRPPKWQNGQLTFPKSIELQNPIIRSIPEEKLLVILHAGPIHRMAKKNRSDSNADIINIISNKYHYASGQIIRPKIAIQSQHKYQLWSQSSPRISLNFAGRLWLSSAVKDHVFTTGHQIKYTDLFIKKSRN